MILLIGSHKDDLLYCSSLLSNKSERPFIGGFELESGQIFSQEILFLSGVYTSVLSSTLISSILEKYFINLVIVMGRCYTTSSSFKPGEIIISKGYANLDVDQIDVANTMLNTIPGYPPLISVQRDLIGYLQDGLAKRTLSTGTIANIYSTDSLNSLSVEKAKANKGILGSKEPFVVDSISYGVALACHVHDIPCISLECVERNIASSKKIDDYVNLLDRYVDMGKAVVYAIGDIGRNDVLRMRGA